MLVFNGFHAVDVVEAPLSVTKSTRTNKTTNNSNRHNDRPLARNIRAVSSNKVYRLEAPGCLVDGRSATVGVRFVSVCFVFVGVG